MMMDESTAGKKNIEDADRKAVRRHPAVSKGASSGKLKEKATARREASGRVKPSVSEARKQGTDAERTVGRTDLPLPPQAGRKAPEPEGRSLGLRLQVSGDRITVLNSLVLDTPGAPPERVRGTDFLAVHSGGEIIALKRLNEPGVAYGIPDPHDPEFRGHREILLDTYELTILVPLQAIDRLAARERTEDQGTDARPSTVEILMLRTPETTDIEPRAMNAIRDRRDVETVASSGELTAEALYEVLWTRGRGGGAKREPTTETQTGDDPAESE